MLVIIQQTNLPNAAQARLALFDVSSPLKIWVSAGLAVDQRTIVDIATANIPGGPNVQASLELGASAAAPIPSWTISSIAVIGQLAQ